jgi:hypothetical protein
MLTFASSRFTDTTWSQNVLYRSQSEFSGCIYGAPQQMSPKIDTKSLVFVIEMNNSQNKVLGIGLVRNHYVTNKTYTIYDTGNFNRYIFVGKYRVDRSDLSSDLLQILDYILFKERTHLKRGAGITTIPDKLFRHQVCCERDIKQEILDTFLKKFDMKKTEEYKEFST